MVVIFVGDVFFGARFARLFKGLNALLFNVEQLRRRSVFYPTLDKLPDSAVLFSFDIFMFFSKFLLWAIHVFFIRVWGFSNADE